MIDRQLGDATVKSDERLRLVFLESCETATRDANDAYRGLAPQLVKAGVAAVVAMQDLVEVKTARPFASTFYRQLLRHGQVDLACNEARDAVRTQKLRGDDVPVLFMALAWAASCRSGYRTICCWSGRRRTFPSASSSSSTSTTRSGGSTSMTSTLITGTRPA